MLQSKIYMYIICEMTQGKAPDILHLMKEVLLTKKRYVGLKDRDLGAK